MQRITNQNLEALAANMAKVTGKTYQVGQVFGLNYSLAEVVKPNGAMREVLSRRTKSALYEDMHTYFQGWREAQQSINENQKA